jgi:hypothetical protein
MESFARLYRKLKTHSGNRTHAEDNLDRQTDRQTEPSYLIVSSFKGNGTVNRLHMEHVHCSRSVVTTHTACRSSRERGLVIKFMCAALRDCVLSVTVSDVSV